MKKEQVDIANKVVFIADSKTPTGVFEVPLTEIAAKAFEDQLKLAGPEPWLFPSPRKPTEHQVAFKKTWERTLRRAGVRYFRLYVRIPGDGDSHSEVMPIIVPTRCRLKIGEVGIIIGISESFH